MKHFANYGKIALIAFGVVFLTGAAGPVTCSQQFAQDVAAIEAKIAAFIAKVREKAPIILQEAENAISLTCGLVPTAQSSVASFTTSIQNPSPRVQGYLNSANKSLAAAAASCATWNAQVNTSNPPTFGQAVQVGVALWNAYQSGKAALQSATTTAAAGG